MNLTGAWPSSALSYERGPGDLGEFDAEEAEEERVESLMSLVPVSAISLVPASADAGARAVGLDDSDATGRSSSLVFPLVAAALAIAGGSWLWMNWHEPATRSAKPTVLTAEYDAQARNMATAAMTAAPPVVQPADLRVPHATPSESTNPMREAIGEVLATYSRSYSALDAASVSALWPGADTVALQHDFSTLRYQNLSFDRCDVRLTGADRAVAACDASINSVQKSGDPAIQHRREPWTIAFYRVDDRWLIERVSAP